MTRGIRAALAAAVGTTTLVLAGSALAANTATVAVSHTPMVLGGSTSTSLHFAVPQTTDPIARIAIYAPAGYVATLGQAPGTTIGSVDAAAYSYDTQITLPLTGSVVTDDPAKHTADACSPGTHAGVWILNLSVSGQTLPVPLYVDPTSGSETALGAYRLIICLPPPDVPVGTPGRASFGAQLLDAKFTVNGIFKTPATAGALRWETLFTPYNRGKGTPNLAGTFEARSLVQLPVVAGIAVVYNKKKATYVLKGRLTEGGTPVPGISVDVFRSTSAATLPRVATAKTKADGSWTFSGRLKPKKTTYFKASASTGERAFAQGCTNPLPVTVAPAGCVSATLSPWSATSAVVRLKP